MNNDEFDEMYQIVKKIGSCWEIRIEAQLMRYIQEELILSVKIPNEFELAGEIRRSFAYDP